MSEKKLIVAIDGPAGSGKSTSAKLVAQKLGYLYIDTGAMYRAITFMALKKNVLNNIEEIISLARNSGITLQYTNGETEVSIDGIDITGEIRTPEVNASVSFVSKIEEVRKALVEKQKEMRKNNCGIVMEGRDIGTVVFPDADVKIFLTASIEERAERRAKEFSSKGLSVPVDDVKSNLVQRDTTDSTRDVSPLVKAADAVEVDTSKVTIEEQVEIIVNEIRKKAELKGIELFI